MDVTAGIMFTQAANFPLTKAWPIFVASFLVEAVTNAISTFPVDLLIRWPTIQEILAFSQQPAV